MTMFVRPDNISANTLVAFTTCARPELIRNNLSCLIHCLQGLRGFDLVVSIDGLSVAGNTEALSLVQKMGVDCIVADEPEGVGISKNRVLSLLGDYDYYFFIEDDVEVLSTDLFNGHIGAYLKTGFHHFSLHEPARLQNESEPTLLRSGEVIRHARFGSAQVNFFTQTALTKVGGWHARFGELRRGGHTEHSYRVCNAGLCPAPFNYIDTLIHCCSWHNPTSIVPAMGYTIAPNCLFDIENNLIAQKLCKQPFYTKYPGRLCFASDPTTNGLRIGNVDAHCNL